jgi:hypothetical protein
MALRGIEQDTLTVRADTSGVTVGDPVVVHVTAQLPAGAQLVDSIPQLRDTLPDGVRLVSTTALHAGPGGYAADVRFVFFRPVSTRIPALAVAYRSNGAVDTLVSVPLPLTIVPTVPDENGTLHDIKDLDAVTVGPSAALALGVVVACAIVAIAVVRRAWSRAAPPSAPSSATRPASPYEQAVAALDGMAAAGPPRSDAVPDHYAATADVVRRFVAVQLGLPALERTTPEIMRLLPPALGANGTRDGLRALLAQADLVKFARERPEPADATRYVERARALLTALHSAAAPDP